MIETDDLTKIYKVKGGEVRALDGANFKVPKGAVLGLFGHNGAGKTTLISLLIGLTLPTSGSGKVLGYDIERESVKIRQKVGLVPEGFGFYEDMTALDNLLFLGELDGIPRSDAKRRAEEALETVRLAELTERKVSTFSRGMKQRLGIAQALQKDPQLLILDEPTAGVDPHGARGFRELVTRLSKEGRTTIISTHLLHEIGMICTHAAVIRQGKILGQGSSEELSRMVTETKGSRYEISVKKGIGRLMDEVRGIKGVKEVSVREDKLIVSADEDAGERIHGLLKEKNYDIESFEALPLSWEDIFMFLHGEVETLA